MPGFGLTALVALGSEREIYVAAGRAFPVVSSMIFLTWTLSTIVGTIIIPERCFVFFDIAFLRLTTAVAFCSPSKVDIVARSTNPIAFLGIVPSTIVSSIERTLFPALRTFVAMLALGTLLSFFLGAYDDG